MPKIQASSIFLLPLLIIAPITSLKRLGAPQNSIFREKRVPQGIMLGLLSEAEQLVLEQCQRHFQWDRWNCSENEFNRWRKRPSQPLTREIAYLDSLLSAGIAYSFALECQETIACLPERMKRETNWDWNHFDFGVEAVNNYLGASSKGDLQSQARFHNINVGKEVVKTTAILKCKCHGTSGTCTIKTCWKKMSSFTTIADQIHKLYKKAFRLDFEGSRGTVPLGNSAAATTRTLLQNVSRHGLVYLHKSPDYCKANIRSGWSGTSGRTCWRSENENNISKKKNCRKLCRQCGRKVLQKKQTSINLCNCKIKESFQVICSNCTTTTREYFCA